MKWWHINNLTTFSIFQNQRPDTERIVWASRMPWSPLQWWPCLHWPQFCCEFVQLTYQGFQKPRYHRYQPLLLFGPVTYFRGMQVGPIAVVLVCLFLMEIFFTRVSTSGVERRLEVRNRDAWNALSDHTASQLLTRGLLLSSSPL